MKTARYLSIAMVGIFVVAPRASADPAPSAPASNPYTQYDPDGVPLAVTRPQAKQLSRGEINAIHKQQEKAALDKNWLLRNYEQQLKIHSAARSPGDEEANLYDELGSNKELAKLAGLPDLDPESKDGATPNRTSAAPTDQTPATVRADASSAPLIGSPSHGNLFKPLIAPLSAPDAASPHNFYSFLPVAMAPTLSVSLPQTPPAPRADQSADSLDIETPGMVAAEKDPLLEKGTPDPNLDILPGESIEQAKAHQDNNTLLELPQPMDATQLHKEQATTLIAPGPTNVSQTATAPPAPVKAAPVEDPNAPMPVSRVPQINPVRSPIANPYDILNR